MNIKNEKGKVGFFVALAILTAIMAIIFSLVGIVNVTERSWFTSYDVTTTEPFEATITKLDCTSGKFKLASQTFYLASVVSEEYIGTIKITELQYARLNIGDVVDVTVVNDEPHIEKYNDSLTIETDCEATITKLACSTDRGQVSCEHNYFAAVTNAESAAVIKITAEQYATLNVGDVVFVQPDGETIKIK